MRGTFARIRQELKQRPAQDFELSLLPLEERTDGIAFKRCESPQVSVIIPVYGKLAYTLTCLRSIAMYPAAASIEVIVVDDASSDASATTLQTIEGLHVHVNAENLGFVGSCNAGAALACGEYLVFLNNDTQVTAGWLDALIHCFHDEPECGLAGSKLIYPDGRLQEAGGWVFSDASAWNVGRFENRNAPRYRYRRRTDYVSGASMMIRRDRFEMLGRFDQRYQPAYYEDTDLAFAVRAAGMSVFYEPNSIVVHCEGVSAGTDITAGMKRYQAINQYTFVSKWPAQLSQQPQPGTPLRAMWQRYTRGHVLVVDATTPEPTRDSGSLRLVSMLRILHQEGWRVSFAPDDGYADDASIAMLGALGIEVLNRPFVPNVPAWLREYGNGLHAVVLCRHTVAGQYAKVVRQRAPQAKLILDTVDLHFLREQRAAELDDSATMRRKAESSRRSELALVNECDVTFVVSAHERSILQQMGPDARIELLSNIHDAHARGKGYANRRDLVFIGGYGHPPNADAVQWIADDILPLLRERMPDITVHVLGDMPESARATLKRPGLIVHGRVEDLAPWLDSCIASLAPLRFGAGVKGKINMAMSYGLPVIATGVAVEGMHLRDGVDVLQADRPEQFVDAVQQLTSDEALWLRISDASIGNVERHFSASAARDVLRAVLG